jgi:acyl dehydratase
LNTTAGATLPPAQRYFEDFVEGEVFQFGDRLVTAEEIIGFALQYDPQPFHTDPVAALDSSFGGLVASGWMTGAVMMRMMCDHFIAPAAAMGSPGLDQLRWLKPVRPGDRLHARVTVLGLQPSRSKPDRGVLSLRQEALNQAGEVVMCIESRALMRCRPAT